jgi:hypothetical protein
MSGAWKTAGLVILMSILIWVSAERAVVTPTTISAELKLNAPPNLRIRFVDELGNIVEPMMVKLEVRASQSRIRRLEQTDMNRPVVRITPEQLGYSPADNNPQVFTPRVVDLLDGELHLGDEGEFLAVTAAEPDVVHVRVTPLLWTELEVKVYDTRNREISFEKLEPPRIGAYVEPANTDCARVVLTQELQAQAGVTDIQAKASLPPGSDPREMDVTVRLPLTAGAVDSIDHPTVGISKPVSMEGRYLVVIEDLDAKLDAYAPIEIQGPQHAREEFRSAPYHLILEVSDRDLNLESPARALQYNLGDLADELIILNPRTEPVRFRVVPVPTENNLAPPPTNNLPPLNPPSPLAPSP